MADVTVRIARPDDAPVWRALRMAGIVENPSVFIVTAEEAAAVPIDADIKRLAKGDRLLAFLGETPVGLAGFNRNGVPRANHRAEIGPLYVAPQVRGQGVSDLIMTQLMDAAQAVGIWQLELFVNVENAPAIALYERHGFVTSGKIPNAIHGADGMEDDLMMIRNLM
ncbi:GNAT family N-acetyltransferase [uncultured Tateyamaria sp.]|uniref:GNAT family N-acetyltransferase n=1 Tax=uncultured Tateyamaria sp. TaxID=455651 RepID=UPI00260C69A5|nr:GNAT family N-acetyltransferase [uncultured Tateyamaria sp.]